MTWLSLHWADLKKCLLCWRRRDPSGRARTVSLATTPTKRCVFAAPNPAALRQRKTKAAPGRQRQQQSLQRWCRHRKEARLSCQRKVIFVSNECIKFFGYFDYFAGWSCSTCFVGNDDSADQCVACSEPRPGAPKSEKSKALFPGSIFQSSSSSSTSESNAVPSKKGWKVIWKRR